MHHNTLSPILYDGTIQNILSISENCEDEIKLEDNIQESKSNDDIISSFLTHNEVSQLEKIIQEVEKEPCRFENFGDSASSISSTGSTRRLVIDETGDYEDDNFEDETTLANRVATAILTPARIEITHDYLQPSFSQQDVEEYFSEPQNPGTNWEEFNNAILEDDGDDKSEENKEKNEEILKKKTEEQFADDLNHVGTDDGLHVINDDDHVINDDDHVINDDDHVIDDDDHVIDDDDHHATEDDEEDELLNEYVRQRKRHIRKNRGLTDEEKIRVITLAQQNPGWSIAKVREKSGCKKLKQIRQIYNWERELNLHDDSKVKELKKINDWVLAKFIHCKRNKQRVTNFMLRDWGKEAGRKFKHRDYKFNASDGWISRFKTANKISGLWTNLHFNKKVLKKKLSLAIEEDEVLPDDEEVSEDPVLPEKAGENSRNEIVTAQNEERGNEENSDPSAFNSIVRKPEPYYQYPDFPARYYNNPYDPYQYPLEWGFQRPPNYYYYYDPRWYYNNGNWNWDNTQNYVDLTGDSSNYQMQNQPGASSDGNSGYSPDYYQDNYEVGEVGSVQVVHQAEVHQEDQDVDGGRKKQRVVSRQGRGKIDQDIDGEKTEKRVLRRSERVSVPVIVNVLSKSEAEKYFCSKKKRGKKGF